MWLRLGGIVLLVVTPVSVYSVISMWRRCILRITPSALAVRLAAPGDVLTEIRVQPIDLVAALVAWKDGVNDNPSELLDRVEGILRGRSTAAVQPLLGQSSSASVAILRAVLAAGKPAYPLAW